VPKAAASGEPAARRDLSLYWWGQSTSAFGSVFTAIAMPVVAVEYLGASPGQVGVISAACVLPALLLGLPAGALADRIARPRRMLIALDTFSASAVGAVALGLADHVASIGWLVALSLIQGCVTILSEIIYFIHLRQLTGGAGIGRARARLQAGEFGAGFAGRLLVGPTIVVLGSAAALSVDAVSYVLSAAALLSMHPAALVPRKPVTSISSTLRGMTAGLRFFVGDAFHRALLVFIMAPVAAAAGAGALTAPFLLRVVHVPTGAYGLIFALSGLLGLAGSVVAGRLLRSRRDPRQVTLASLTAGIACALVLPLSFGPWPLAASCAALGIGLPVFFGSIANVALSPVLVADVSEEAMGRTMAMLQVSAAAAGLLGALAGGALGDWIGPRNAIWAMDAFGLGAVALALPPAVRTARRLRGASGLAPDELVKAAG
jgi:MFS family permease